MGANAEAAPIDSIGQTAGLVWRYLNAKGPVSLTVLVHEAKVPRDLLMQALGWLARENKLEFSEVKRRKTVGLRR
jgi:hypothetical protein